MKYVGVTKSGDVLLEASQTEVECLVGCVRALQEVIRGSTDRLVESAVMANVPREIPLPAPVGSTSAGSKKRCTKVRRHGSSSKVAASGSGSGSKPERLCEICGKVIPNAGSRKVHAGECFREKLRLAWKNKYSKRPYAKNAKTVVAAGGKTAVGKDKPALKARREEVVEREEPDPVQRIRESLERVERNLE